MLTLLQDKIDTRWGRCGSFAMNNLTCAPWSGISTVTVWSNCSTSTTAMRVMNVLMRAIRAG